MPQLPIATWRVAVRSSWLLVARLSTPLGSRTTNAALAEQIQNLSAILPAISNQLESLQVDQRRLEALVSSNVEQQKIPPYRQPFASVPPLPARQGSASQFLQKIGSPPAGRTRPAMPRASAPEPPVPGEEPNLVPSEEGYLEQLQSSQPPQMSEVLLQQSQALTTLMAHLTSQDGLMDLRASSSSTTALSLGGSAGRDRLLQELASRKGNFLLKVAQNAHRRLRPSEAPPASIGEFQNTPVFAKYLERWLLCQVGDQMLQGDNLGAQEMLALAMVAVEQCAQDGGRWEVGWILSLQEDPPPGVFQHRPAATNPRLRAFATFCPPDWAACALSYVKELDIMTTRRQGALPPKKGKDQKTEDGDPNKPPKPKNPRSTKLAPDGSLFPLPIPKTGIFAQRSCGSKERRRRSLDRAFHIMVMALNYWHADFKFVPIAAVSVQPNEGQRTLLQNLRKLVRAFGVCQDEVSIPDSGRRSSTLIALLADLSEFLTWEGLAGDAYMRGFPGVDGGLQELAKVPVDKTRDDSLVPYRALDAGRLKITGTAAWDPSAFLTDEFWLAFHEPDSLKWTDEPPTEDFPCLEKEDYDAVLELVKLWDVRGLVCFKDAPLSDDWSRYGDIRFFNCFKNVDADRMIGDRRIRNWKEGKLPGPSRGLPTAVGLSQLEIEPFLQKASICVSDRRDFYHQFKVSPQRARTNGLWPCLRISDVKHLDAFKRFEQDHVRVRYDRRKHGDALGDGKSKQVPAISGSHVQACFASIPQGDHLGVEFATCAHREFLSRHGLLVAEEELRADNVWRGQKVVQGLVIDDFYAVSVEDVALDQEPKPSDIPTSSASARMAIASQVYDQYGILGSADKDIKNEQKAKVTGGELDTTDEVRRLVLALLGSPVRKRLALSMITLELVQLRATTDVLHACLLGGWTHCLMYRRPFMSLLSKSYHLCPSDQIDQDEPKLCSLPRSVAEELLMLAIFAPFMTVDLVAKTDELLYATDASEAKGAYVAKRVGHEVSRALWRTGRKKGGYVRMLNREEALIRKIDEMKEEHLFPLGFASQQHAVSPEKPRAHRFHFIEVCGGSGKISRAMSNRGWTVGPVLDLDSSPFFNLRSLKLLSWICHLLEHGLLDSFMVEPPCTTFSPAQYPPSRSYEQPRGFDPLCPKTLEGTELALRALTLMYLAAIYDIPALLEQPRRTKMKRLSEWRFLLENELAAETWLASCQYGSPHQKEFVFLATFEEVVKLHRKCSKDHDHIKIEGQWTKQSATYTDQLAEAVAGAFDKALNRKLRSERLQTPKTEGLENVLVNDLLLSGGWFVKKSWPWRKPAHINILETSVACRLAKELALTKPRLRLVIHVKYKHFPWTYCASAFRHLDFDGTLGFPGEGPSFWTSGSCRLAPTRRCLDFLALRGPFKGLMDFAEVPCSIPSFVCLLCACLLAVTCESSWTSEFPVGFGIRFGGVFWEGFGQKKRPPNGCSSCLFSVPKPSGNLQSWTVDFVGYSMAARPLDSFTLRGPFKGLMDFAEIPCVLLAVVPPCLFWIFVVCFGIRRLVSSLGSSVSLWSLDFVALRGPFKDFMDFAEIPCAISLDRLAASFWFRPCLFSWPLRHWTFTVRPSPERSTARLIPRCSVSPAGKPTHKITPKVFLWCLIWLGSTRLCHGAPMRTELKPRDAGDLKRARQRDANEDLPAGRPVLQQTQAYRDKLLTAFDEWLATEGFSVDMLLGTMNPDIDAVNCLLEKYGRQLYRAGRPYGHYAETINAIAAKRPRIKRSMAQAWDLAYAWLRKEPPIHHVALPWQALLSLLATSLAWGWPREAGVIALSWGGITRIGEVLSAFRRNLVLPFDFGGTEDFALLEIPEPKTRFTTARHQAARLDQPQLLSVVELAFKNLLPGEKLWPSSAQTMRKRFQKLLDVNGLGQFASGRGILASHGDLMYDALILAKQQDFDVFNALDIMENESFLKDLKFGIGDGYLQYYLYNWKCPRIEPKGIGLVLL
eukprot:s366_g11.t1